MRARWFAFGALLVLCMGIVRGGPYGVLFPGHGRLTSNGVMIFLDEDFDGIYDESEPNFLNLATNTAGDEIVNGDLDIVGEATIKGKDVARRIASLTTLTTDIPDPFDCWTWETAATRVAQTAFDVDDTCQFTLPNDTYLVEVCASIHDGAVGGNNCILQVYAEGASGSPYATINFAAAGGDLGAEGSRYCEAVGQNIAEGTVLYVAADADAADCDASVSWPRAFIELNGQEIAIP